MNILSEKRLRSDFSEVWQVLSPVSDKWITLKNQDDDFNECNNKRILTEMKLKESLDKVSRRNMQIKDLNAKFKGLCICTLESECPSQKII